MPCVKSPPRTWRRKGNALLRIASDTACSDGPFDKPKFNGINCVRGGRRYSLQAQGDFCGTAYRGLQEKFTSTPYPAKVSFCTTRNHLNHFSHKKTIIQRDADETFAYHRRL